MVQRADDLRNIDLRPHSPPGGRAGCARRPWNSDGNADTRLPHLCRDERGFTGAEKALMICFALAIIAFGGYLLSGGSQVAASDARRALVERSGPTGGIRGTVQPIHAGGGVKGPGQQSGGGEVQGPEKGGEAQGGGQGGEGEAGKKESPLKIGGEGGGKVQHRTKQKEGEKGWGGGAEKKDDPDKGKKTKTEFDAEIGAEYKFLDEEGALKQGKFAGGTETVSGGYGKLDGSAYGKASLKEGLAAGAKIEGKASALNWQGKHELPAGVQESHEVDVLSVKGGIDAGAGVSKEMVGAKLSGEAGANLVEGKIEAKKTFKLPFIPIGLEVGGTGTGSVGANIGGEARAGYFREEGKSKLGLKLGGKAALGLGAGFKVSFNLVW